MRRKVIGEFAGTLAALAAVTVYMQLRDPLSPARLWLSEQADLLREWRISVKVNRLINSTVKEES